MAFTNLHRVLGQLRRFGAGSFDGAVGGMYLGITEMHQRAKFVYCPIDFGPLRLSSKVEVEPPEPARRRMSISFGGDGVHYAVIVHERLDLTHNSPTQAKYLQRAVDELSPRLTELVGRGAASGAKRKLR